MDYIRSATLFIPIRFSKKFCTVIEGSSMSPLTIKGINLKSIGKPTIIISSSKLRWYLFNTNSLMLECFNCFCIKHKSTRYYLMYPIFHFTNFNYHSNIWRKFLLNFFSKIGVNNNTKLRSEHISKHYVVRHIEACFKYLLHTEVDRQWNLYSCYPNLHQ